MRVLLIRHPAAVDRGVAECLAQIPGVDQVKITGPALHAVAVLRATAPDLVVMETDGCEEDSISLLS